MPASLPPHVSRNQREWDRWADEYAEVGERHWRDDVPCWGLWETPESTIGVVGKVSGLGVVELGCGTAYWSAWLARRGARPVGVDLSERQLATARRLQAEHGLHFPLLQASAEDVPLPSGAFDLAFSEYGAALWCEPARWLAEAARLLRPGGRLVFMTNSPLLMLCTPPVGPPSDRLVRDQFGMHRFEWPDDDSVEFHLPHGEMLRLLRRLGFEVEDLVELRAPEGATTRYPVPYEWARRWPCEEIWVARRR